ncbi:MAG: hypothetical protein CMH34_11140 [Microbacterium sp.]|nr:hypothetical protein [Microbacterium sp.]
MNRTLPGLALTAAALFTLTGCVGDDPGQSSSGAGSAQKLDAPGDEGQSVEDACSVVAETITAATAQFEEGAEDDLSSVAEAMEAAAEELATMTQEITNDRVAALLPDLTQMFGEAADVFRSLEDGDASGIEDLEEIGTRFQETGAAFEETCTP